MFQKIEEGRGFTNPGIKVEFANISGQDHEFSKIPRFVTCSADGELVVDLAGGQEEVTIQVFKGYNPIRIKKIYEAESGGSDSITVEGWV